MLQVWRAASRSTPLALAWAWCLVAINDTTVSPGAALARLQVAQVGGGNSRLLASHPWICGAPHQRSWVVLHFLKAPQTESLRCYAQLPWAPVLTPEPTSCKPAGALEVTVGCVHYLGPPRRPARRRLAPPASPVASAALLPLLPVQVSSTVQLAMAASVPADAAAAFAQYDRNSSGAIEVDELKALLRELLGGRACLLLGGCWGGCSGPLQSWGRLHGGMTWTAASCGLLLIAGSLFLQGLVRPNPKCCAVRSGAIA